MSPKEPAEKTRDKYRFVVEAKPGEPAKLVVDEQRTEPQMLARQNIDDNTIAFYIRSDKVSDKVKAAPASHQAKQAIQEVARKCGQLEQQLRWIDEQQGRIREDMGKLDHATDLYKRYVKKLSDQEDEIEKLHPEIKKLQDHENELRQVARRFPDRPGHRLRLGQATRGLSRFLRGAGGGHRREQWSASGSRVGKNGTGYPLGAFTAGCNQANAARPCCSLSRARTTAPAWWR